MRTVLRALPEGAPALQDWDACGRWQTFSMRLWLWGTPNSHPKSPPETAWDENQPNQFWICVCFLKKLGHNSFSFFVKKRSSCPQSRRVCFLHPTGILSPGLEGAGFSGHFSQQTSFPRRWFSEEQICPDRIEPAFLEQPEHFKPGVQSSKAL